MITSEILEAGISRTALTGVNDDEALVVLKGIGAGVLGTIPPCLGGLCLSNELYPRLPFVQGLQLQCALAGLILCLLALPIVYLSIRAKNSFIAAVASIITLFVASSLAGLCCR